MTIDTAPMLVNSVDFTDGHLFRIDTVNRVGVDVIVTKIDGWWGVPGRTSWQERATDGTFGETLWREGRKITLGVTEILPGRVQVEERARQVAACFPSGAEGAGTLTVGGITGPLTAYGLALDGEVKVEHSLPGLWVRYEIPMMAPDPYLYGEPQSGQVATSTVGVGLEYALFDDGDGATTGVLEYGQAITTSIELTNPGNAPAYPVIVVGGTLPSGFRLDLAGDGPARWGVTYRGDVTRQAPVTVDFAGRVQVGGIDRSWLLTRRDWGGVAPGGRVSARLEPFGAGDGWADVSLYPTYL